MTADTIPDTSRLLRDGINAIRLGDKSGARELFRLVTKSDAGSETAWLCLASLAETVAERVECLKRVLAINPANQQAISILRVTRNSAPVFNELLQKGIKAAKAGDHGIATELLLEVIEDEPQNEAAWLWLASVTKDVEDKLAYLHRVLAINPANKFATQMFGRTKTQIARQLLKKGIAAFQRNDRQEARAILLDVMEYAQNIEEGWLLMAYLTDSPEEKTRHLERVLLINPANERARSSLERVKAQLAAPVTLTPPAAPVAFTNPPAPVTLSAPTLPQLESKNEPPEADVSAAAWECPLCLTQASAATDACLACGAQLTLHDLDRLLDNDKVDPAAMQAALG